MENVDQDPNAAAVEKQQAAFDADVAQIKQAVLRRYSIEELRQEIRKPSPQHSSRGLRALFWKDHQAELVAIVEQLKGAMLPHCSIAELRQELSRRPGRRRRAAP